MNPQYDYIVGQHGPLAPLYARAVHPNYNMISPPYGWIPLVLKLDEELAAIYPDYTVFQVKEKFGGLRYYIGVFVPSGLRANGVLADQANDLIRKAEADSFKICQVCGAPAETRYFTYLVATLCDDHTE